jgi:phage terminase small subunit
MPGTHRSGRRPKATRLHELEGTRPHRSRAKEPAPPAGEAPRPAAFDADPHAQLAWAYFCAQLKAVGVLTVDCQATLTCLAHAWADYQRFLTSWQRDYRPVIVQEFVDSEGTVRRKIVPNPLVRILRDQARLVSALASEFGLSPVAVARVTRVGAGTPDPFEEFLNTPPPVLPFGPRSPLRRSGTR